MHGGPSIRQLAVAVGLGVAALLPAAEVRIVGSDVLGAEFSAAVLRGAERLGDTVTLALDGSRPGLGRLRGTWADLGLISLPPAELGELRVFHAEPLAYHCVWVVAARECPLEQITLAQLERAFGAASGALKWRDLGVTGAWAERDVRAFAPAAGAGVGPEIFRSLVLRGGRWGEEVARFRDEDELAARLQRDPQALAIVMRRPDEKRFRVLPVAKGEGDAAAAPTRELLHAGRYPLQLPLFLVLRAERKDALWAWIAWWRSTEAAAALERAGLVPAPAQRGADAVK